MLDVPDFIRKAHEIYGYQHFVNDSAGSLCELDDPSVLAVLAEHTLIVYIEATADNGRELLRRVYPEDDIRLFGGTPVWFQCSCSRERVAGILQSLGEDELQALLRERDDVEVRCEFCNRAWQFDAVDVASLFSEGNRQSAPPGLH